MPSEYFQQANGSALSNWPGYDLVQQAATDSGIPSGSLWLIIAMVICAVVGVVVWMISSSILLVVISMAVVIGIVSIMGLVPMWILYVFIIFGLIGLGVLKTAA
jgi:ABC-type bacteriocin/lantibiotic exporter with double-glycine peptidase domain